MNSEFTAMLDNRQALIIVLILAFMIFGYIAYSHSQRTVTYQMPVPPPTTVPANN